jgi:two-component system chemotaxis sensor kinase CheA
VAQALPLNSISPLAHTSELTLPRDPLPDVGGQLAAAPNPLPEKEEEPTRRVPINGAAESTLRVDVVLLNRMMNLVGELVLTRNQVLQATAADPNLTLLCRRLDMVTADLRESVMKARMQPVSNVFSKMPRMVRDLSQALNRRVRLVMEGQETELDRFHQHQDSDGYHRSRKRLHHPRP